MEANATVLVIDDEPGCHESLGRALDDSRGVRRLSAYNAFQAREILKREPVDVILLDLGLPGLRGDQFMKELSADITAGRMEVVIFSSQDSVAAAVTCTKYGAFDYVIKTHETFRQAELLIKRALEHRRLRRSALVQRSAAVAQQHVTQLLRSSSLEIKQLVERAHALAGGRGHVLLEGEGGTGAEHLAHFLHVSSMRAEGPFVTVDARVLGEVEAMAALTPAAGSAGRMCEVDLADGGSLFIDGVEHLGERAQRRLVTLLRTQAAVALPGERKPGAADVRVIASCAPGGALELDPGLREELDGARLRLPPLRERRDDIPVLLAWSAERRLHPAARPRFTDAAIRALTDYGWPRNLVELEEMVAQLGATKAGGVIELSDLPVAVVVAHLAARHERAAGGGGRTGGILYEQMMAHFERTLLVQMLALHGGDYAKAADALGIPLAILRRQLRQLGMARSATRPPDPGEGPGED